MNNLKYILLTYDALFEFASGRTFQSAEFSQSEQLYQLLMQQSSDWSHPTIHVTMTAKKGAIFYTDSIDKKRGLLFDLDTFDGFVNRGADAVITIFQKTIKYAIHYFDNQPLAPCEMNLNATTGIVFPFPFTATKGVEKVILDRNSTRQNRKDQDFLVAYYFGVEPSTFIHANLNKAVDELASIQINRTRDDKAHVQSMTVSQIDTPTFMIDSPMHYNQWETYLTKKQKEFIQRPVEGAERLEGPAGSGKTLSLILRCIHLMTKAVNEQKTLKIIFLTHSTATKQRIQQLFSIIYPEFADHCEEHDNHPDVSVLITTLQEWSQNNLGSNTIYDTEIIDKDAGVSKEYQMMMIAESFEEVILKSWGGYSAICSPEFVRFIQSHQTQEIVEILQYEISVVIKGRAEGNKEKYKKLERPKFGLPLTTDEDKLFAYQIFENYQNKLEKNGYFDTDDITLSALGQLDTPIWKRRSLKEGYDICFIDEAHLFNMNELSVFHYLTKPTRRNHIVFVLDKSQCTAEVGFSEEELSILEGENKCHTRLSTIFRSSPEIINLAYNVLSTNVGLFTHFENPLDYCLSPFTIKEEQKCQKPRYILLATDKEMVEAAIADAETYCQHFGVRKSDVLIAVTEMTLLNNIVLKYLKESNKPFVEVQSRNDYHAVSMAKRDNKFVVSGVDFVGGLEFDAVFIVGVDKERVPPTGNSRSIYDHFVEYSWHNRMYVAISRAKYYVAMYANALKGESEVLETAIASKIIQKEDLACKRKGKR